MLRPYFNSLNNKTTLDLKIPVSTSFSSPPSLKYSPNSISSLVEVLSQFHLQPSICSILQILLHIINTFWGCYWRFHKTCSTEYPSTEMARNNLISLLSSSFYV